MDNENMIEHGITFKAIIGAIGKPLLALAVILGFDHIFDFCILQIESHAFLSPYLREFMLDIKALLGVLISLLVMIRLIIGIKKLTQK